MMRLYTQGGGLLRLTYAVDDIAAAVRRDTQFIGRTLKDEGGNILLDRVAGPDDRDFIYASIRDSAMLYEASVPAHLKGDSVLSASTGQVTITVKDRGLADKSILEQVHRHTLMFIAHMVVKTWFDRVGVSAGAESHAAQAAAAMAAVLRLMSQTLLQSRQHGTRHPKIDPQTYTQPLGGKFLGGYKTIDHLTEVHQTSMTRADVAYIETLSTYVVYDGSQWRTVEYLTEQAISLGRVIDASVPDAAFPSTGKGKVFYIAKGGSLSGVKVSAGDVLLAIADNKKTTQGGCGTEGCTTEGCTTEGCMTNDPVFDTIDID